MNITIWWPDHYFSDDGSVSWAQYVRGASYIQFKLFRALSHQRIFSSRRVLR